MAHLTVEDENFMELKDSLQETLGELQRGWRILAFNILIKDLGNSGRGRGGADVGAMGKEIKRGLVKTLADAAGRDYVRSVLEGTPHTELPLWVVDWGFVQADFDLARKLQKESVADDHLVMEARDAIDKAAAIHIREIFAMDAVAAMNMNCLMNVAERKETRT